MFLRVSDCCDLSPINNFNPISPGLFEGGSVPAPAAYNSKTVNDNEMK